MTELIRADSFDAIAVPTGGRRRGAHQGDPAADGGEGQLPRRCRRPQVAAGRGCRTGGATEQREQRSIDQARVAVARHRPPFWLLSAEEQRLGQDAAQRNHSHSAKGEHTFSLSTLDFVHHILHILLRHHLRQ